MKEGKMIKVAVIGLGKMGLLHASLLRVLPGVRLVALCDKSGLIRRVCKQMFKDVFITDDVEKFVGLGLEAVYVTTPIPSHFSVVKKICSLNLSSNLFVEKTLATNYNDAKEMCMLAQRIGGVNMVGYMKRFAVTFIKGKELLNKGAIGEVSSFDAYAYSSDFVNIKTGAIAGSRGGVLGDLGSHVFDLALWYFGDLKINFAKLKSWSSEAEDEASAEVSCSGRVQGRFDVSWCKEGFRMPEIGITIQGTKGSIRVTDDDVRLELNDGKIYRWFRHDLNDSVSFLLGASEYFREDKHFIESILNGKCAEPDFLTAAK
ncbi:MAG: Gfo/Idh/MocA family oxidoreductase, partial [Candidatus Bathyarchaeia archaeon]